MKKLMILLPLLLIGCEKEMTLEERVVARWQAIVDSDYSSAYAFLAPTYRTVENEQSFAIRMETAKIHTQWQSAEFVSKACEDVVCDITLKLHYIYSFPRKSMGQSEMITNISEKWIQKEGVWYHMPEKLK